MFFKAVLTEKTNDVPNCDTGFRSSPASLIDDPLHHQFNHPLDLIV